MTIFRYSLAILAVAAPVLAETVVTPGGLTLDMYAVIVEPDTGMARFRFMTPDLATFGADAAYPDMQWLCDTVALPEVQDNRSTK